MKTGSRRSRSDDREVLFKVYAAAVNPLDYHMLKGWAVLMRWILDGGKLSQPDADVAGLAEQAGPGVTQFKAGDAVFGTCRDETQSIRSRNHRDFRLMSHSISE